MTDMQCMVCGRNFDSYDPLAYTHGTGCKMIPKISFKEKLKEIERNNLLDREWEGFLWTLKVWSILSLIFIGVIELK